MVYIISLVVSAIAVIAVLLYRNKTSKVSESSESVFCVYTTKSICSKSKNINCVVHDADGDWQFLNTDEELLTENACLLALDEIVEIDYTVDDVLNMEEGYYATRSDIHDKWKIDKIEE